MSSIVSISVDYISVTKKKEREREREQVFIGKQKDDLDGVAVPTPYIQRITILLHR